MENTITTRNILFQLIILATIMVCLPFGTGVTLAECIVKLENENDIDYLDDKSSIMQELHLSFPNYNVNPLIYDTLDYKPWKWFRTRGQHGRTLLTLCFDYNVQSMSILNIGVIVETIRLVDEPFGCFGDIPLKERVPVIRTVILNNFGKKNGTTLSSEPETLSDEAYDPIHVCNEIIEDDNGYGYFDKMCCMLDETNSAICEVQNQQFWIRVLYNSILLVKTATFFCSPLLLLKLIRNISPKTSEYAVKLSKEIKLKIYISKNGKKNVNYKKCFTYNDIYQWPKFLKAIHQLPHNKVLNAKLPELRIRVESKQVVAENKPPTGLIHTLYDNLVRCKIRNMDTFRECCSLGILGTIFGSRNVSVTWHTCLKAFVHILIFVLFPTPFYLRLFLFYYFEKEELEMQRRSLNWTQLKEPFDIYHKDLLQFFTPTHGLMITSYVLYLLVGFIGSLSKHPIKTNLQAIVYKALQDMSNVSYCGVLNVIIDITLWPFKKFGVLAFVVYPLICAVTGPVVIIIFIIYCIPTVYLTFRLLYYCTKMLIDTDSVASDLQTEGFRRKCSDIDVMIHNSNKTYIKRVPSIDENTFTTMEKSIYAFRKKNDHLLGAGSRSKYVLNAVRICMTRIAAGCFCVLCLIAMLMIFTELTEMAVSFLAFTMMGIIVHAGSTLRYVTMVLLLIMYMHECFNNVYKNYLLFTSSVFEDIMQRTDSLTEVARLPENMQENFAFQLRPVKGIEEFMTALNFDKKEPRWRIGHMALFLDSLDTPRIPLKLFKNLCAINVHGAPGPVYLNLLQATGKFLIIVVFLFFVMIVVMAFGDMHKMSSTNQMLATLAGGFVPMMLQNVVSTKTKQLNLKTLSFQGNVDEVIGEFEQFWPLTDIVIEEDCGETSNKSADISDISRIEKGSSTVPCSTPISRNNLVIEKTANFKTSSSMKKMGGHYIITLYSKFMASTKQITDISKGIFGMNCELKEDVDLLIDLDEPKKTEPWVIYDSMSSLSGHSSFYNGDNRTLKNRLQELNSQSDLLLV